MKDIDEIKKIIADYVNSDKEIPPEILEILEEYYRSLL